MQAFVNTRHTPPVCICVLVLVYFFFFLLLQDYPLSQVGTKYALLVSYAQFANGLFSDLSYTFSGQAETVAYFLQSHLGLGYAETHFNYIAFALVEDI